MQQGIGRKIVVAIGMLVVAGLLIVLYQWGNAREDTSKDRPIADGQTMYSFAMGTSVSVSLYGTQDTEYAKIEQAIKDLDEQEISWRQEGSALYKLNHTYTAGEAAEVSDTLYRVGHHDSPTCESLEYRVGDGGRFSCPDRYRNQRSARKDRL